MNRFLAVLAALALVLNAQAAEGYKPEGSGNKDTRPVKTETQPVDPKAVDPHAGHDHAGQGHGSKPATDSEPMEKAAPDFTTALDFSILETIAIQDGGRNKPLNTFITEKMELISGRKLFKGTPEITDKISKQKINGNDLFLGLWLRRQDMIRAPIILVSYAPLKEALGLPKEEKHFSFVRLRDGSKLLDMTQGIHQKRMDGNDKDLTDIEKEAEIVLKRMNVAWMIINGTEELSLVPHPSKADGDWTSLAGLSESFGDLKQSPWNEAKSRVLFEKFEAFARAYRERNPSEFAKSAQELRSEIAGLSSYYPTLPELNREISYNKSRPFMWAWVFYLFASVLGLFALKYEGRTLYRIMMGAFVIGLGLHVYGFVLRCLIAGRPPVSNMYESVIWVGFGAVFFGLIFEMIYRKRYFALCGAASGFVCLALMDTVPIMLGNSELPGFASDISPLQPVLRDNFWLTIHVLTITLSYAAFKLGWVLGHVTLISHMFRPHKKAEHFELHQFLYRVMQVGVLLLAIGTILGGVWAYYSWGRFWGWDPKETWAFIALLGYLFILHGRFAGWWSNFGLSVGSVLGFWPVVFAWYGVNFVLGKGMHSYGTGAGGEIYVASVFGLDIVFMIAGTIMYMRYKGGSGSNTSGPSDESKLTAADPITDARAKELDQAAPSAGE